MEKCWASDTQYNAVLTETDGTNPEAIYEDNQGTFATDNPSGKEITLWEEHCPKHFWVSPGTGDSTVTTDGFGNYLNEMWNPTGGSDIREIHFRQFGFTSDDAIDAANSNDKIYYHCLIRVCDSSAISECNSKTITGTTVTCPTYADFAPNSAGRRRRDITKRSSDIVQAGQLGKQDVLVKDAQVRGP